MQKIKWIIFGIVFFVLLAAVIGILYFPWHYEAIAVADNLYFGMSPLEVRLRYGTPIEIQNSTVSPEKTYVYYTSVEGLPAKLNITFIQSNISYRLYRVDIGIDVSGAGLQETYNGILEECRDAYHGNISQYEEDKENEASVINSSGATSIYCKIWIEQGSVYITAIKAW